MNREEVILEVGNKVREYGKEVLLYIEPDPNEFARNIVDFLDSINYQVDDEFNEFNVRPVEA